MRRMKWEFNESCWSQVHYNQLKKIQEIYIDRKWTCDLGEYVTIDSEIKI